MGENWLDTIHNNILNGNLQDATTQIGEYGMYDFWEDYKHYLVEHYTEAAKRFYHFTHATIAYHRIMGERA